MGRFLTPFWANLAPSWHSKTFQNEPKLALKSIQVGALIWELFSEWYLVDFYWLFCKTEHSRGHEYSIKANEFWTFLFLGCCVVGLICWLIFDWFFVVVGSKNRPKIDQKSIQKPMENKLQAGMDFGWLLGWFLVDLGAMLGAKLAPKSAKWRCQDDVKKCIVKVLRRCTPPHVFKKDVDKKLRGWISKNGQFHIQNKIRKHTLRKFRPLELHLVRCYVEL